jgi:NTP pyrophosphatase (non-canonical NTP hydrolase)
VSDFNEYQTRAHATAVYPQELGIIYPVMKLAGEAGEISEKIGKALRKGDIYIMPNGEVSGLRPDHHEDLIKELGDVLWYVAEIATVLGVPLGQVASRNIDKLADRSLRGVLVGEGDNR